MKSLIIDEKYQNLRLDKALCRILDVSFALSQKIIRQKKVKINGKNCQASHKLEQGDLLEIWYELDLRKISATKKSNLTKAQIIKFKSYIIYEDDKILAINKPSGLATQGGSGITTSVDDFARQNSWQLVHRLDKDTSGCLLIAKNKEIADLLTLLFKSKNIDKTYLALVNGLPNKNFGQIAIPLRKKIQGKNEKVMPDFEQGKEAITNFKVLKKFTDYSLVELKPITGRTHQLRVHMKELGHAIINDVKYGGKVVLRKDISNRLCLHAQRITINDYFGQKLQINAPIPKEMGL